MVKIVPLTTSQKNYKDSAPTAAARYRDAASTIEWRAPAEAGQELYVERMRDPEVLERRVEGIRDVTDSDFRNAVITKGVPVIQTRMAQSDGKWASGFSPYHSALAALELPPRVSDWEQNVLNRLVPVIKAMLDVKNRIG